MKTIEANKAPKALSNAFGDDAHSVKSFQCRLAQRFPDCTYKFMARHVVVWECNVIVSYEGRLYDLKFTKGGAITRGAMRSVDLYGDYVRAA